MKQERKEILFGVVGTLTMFLCIFVITFVHEMGHMVATLLLGGSVPEVNITLFDGGFVKSHFDYTSTYVMGQISIFVLMSGGLAVALLFLLLGYFKRPLLLVVPLALIDGILEASFAATQLRIHVMQLSLLIVVLTYLHIFKVHIWDKGLKLN